MFGHGSGFFVSLDRIVTNYHVIADAYTVEVKTIDGKVFAVDRILAIDRRGDLALLHANLQATTRVAQLTMARTLPQEGENVFVIGSPLGLEGTTSEGIVSAVRFVEGFGYVVQITAPILPGSSGGPVLNMQGKVVGAATLIARDGQNLNLAMSGERVLALGGRERATNIYAQGVQLFQARNYAGALSAFQTAVRLDPENEDAWSQIGDCQRELGRRADAIAAYNQVIRLDPKNVEAYINAGVSYQALEQHGTALDYYRYAARLAPRYGLAHYNIGIAYFDLSNYMSAVQAFQTALDINPKDALAHYAPGAAYVRLRDKKAAKKGVQSDVNLRRTIS